MLNFMIFLVLAALLAVLFVPSWHEAFSGLLTMLAQLFADLSGRL